MVTGTGLRIDHVTKFMDVPPPNPLRCTHYIRWLIFRLESTTGHGPLLSSRAGYPMKYCSHCGHKTVVRTPEGDHMPRHVCDHCGTVHYENPRIVVGCVPEHEGRILLCRRAIEPRRGYWTFPAGFLENGETLEAGAARECHEEALATVQVGSLLAICNIPEAHQVHIFFRARMTDASFGAGVESLESVMVTESEMPWADIAFASTRFGLEQFLADRARGVELPHLTTLARRTSV
jgi:ADP-ribose pyrophosphatase YjhB (NUDIX family)